MTQPDRAELLAEATALAEQAAGAIMGYFRGDVDVRRKQDASPVTAADHAAEQIIVAGLRRLTPDIPVVAEEEMAGGRSVDVGGGRFWLVDPLDGTKEFIAQRDEFTVNIALIEDGVPVLGAVVVPARGATYTAAGPGTATVRRDGEARPISARVVPATGAIVVASRSHGDMKKIQALMDRLSSDRLKISGSSVKFCLIAEGEADIYPRYGPTREWDTAAGHAVLAAAGGSVRTSDGKDLVYGKAGFLNGAFIARGRDG